MFRFITINRRRNLTFLGLPNGYTDSLRLLQTLAKSKSKKSNKSQNQDNPTVSYLNRKCGLPLDSAISASKEVAITNTQRADSVLQLFKSYHFTPPQITDIITKCPSVLVAYPDKTLSRLNFFMSLGLSKSDIVSILFPNRHFLETSLANTTVPAVDFLKSILQTNENLISTLRRWSYIAFRNFRIEFEPNVLTLRAHGMPELNICKMLMSHPRVFSIRNDLFENRVKRVEQMGFSPDSLAYLRAVRVMGGIGEERWKKKVDAFKSFGWSDEDIVLAFKKQPLFMDASEQKIRKLMDFYLNKLRLKVSDVVNCPNLLTWSLEKRVIPRCLVLQLLLSKGFVKSDLSIVWVIHTCKSRFDSQFVTKYLEIIPEMESVYQGEKRLEAFEATHFAAMLD